MALSLDLAVEMHNYVWLLGEPDGQCERMKPNNFINTINTTTTKQLM